MFAWLLFCLSILAITRSEDELVSGTKEGPLNEETNGDVSIRGASHWCPPSYAEKHPDHFMCSVSGGCAGYNYIPHNMSDFEKMAIVHLNNKLRQNVAVGKAWGQSSAQNMMQLSWSDKLASFADRLVLQCRSPNNTHLKIGVAYGDEFDVNKIENFNWHPRVLTDQKTRLPLKQTFVEHAYKVAVCQKKFKQSRLTNFYYDQTTGTYSYMMWGNSKYIGCSFLEYELRDFDVDFTVAENALFICFYGPGVPHDVPKSPSGYVAPSKKIMYKPGFPDCAMNSTLYPGLCVTDMKNNRDPCQNEEFAAHYPDLCNDLFYDGLCGPLKVDPGIPWIFIITIVSLVLLLVVGLLAFYYRENVQDLLDDWMR